MTEIILVRHGETAWNAAGIYRGRTDIELNENGVRQAALLAEYLGNMKLDAIYSSPMKRALQTAGEIAGYSDLRVNIAPGLIDFNYGKWQGLSRQQVEGKYKELYEEWMTCPDLVQMPEGENLDYVRKRAMMVVDEVTGKHKEGGVILVSHRVVNKVLICALLGLDNSHFWNIRLDTCGITIFAYEKGRFILIRHNDTSYQKPACGAAPVDF